MPDRPGRGRTRRRARVVRVAPERFGFGLRLIDPTAIPPTIIKRMRPDLEIDVVRSIDLAAFTLEGYELELRSGAKPVIRTRRGRDGYLVVRLAYQHLGEYAIYEEPAPVPKPNDPKNVVPLPSKDLSTDPPPHLVTAPVDARPARGSRLVFAVPDGTEIPFSTEGILAAVGDLEMAVHPLAVPTPGRIVVAAGREYQLGGNLVATAHGAGLVISTATARAARHDLSTAAGLAARHRDKRIVRNLLATRPGTVSRGPVPEAVPNSSVRIGARTHEIAPIVGRGGLVVPERRFPKPRLRERRSRPPRALETSIEAPYRLVISPSGRGGWAHSNRPASAEGADHRVELWHTRLGVRRDDDGAPSIDERKDHWQRIIRALWARDRDALPGWRTQDRPDVDVGPFRMSLESPDRELLVRQSSETPVFGGVALPPTPVDATELMLSSLGAWLDLHGEWDTDPYSNVGARSILSWDHVAPIGRDQFVRVVYPGYLFPSGHQTTLVKITERKMKQVSPSVAGLYQRMFLVCGEPLRTYDDDHQQFPLSEIRIAPLVTPTIDEPSDAERARHFFPTIAGQPFRWTLHAKDLEHRPVRFSTPLLWVSAGFAISTSSQQQVRDAYKLHDNVAADGQMIAFTEVSRGGDTASPTEILSLTGDPDPVRSEPKMTSAKIRLKAAQQLGTDKPVTISYAANYLANGFNQSANPGEVWAELAQSITLEFGSGNPSDKAGGFVQPNLPIEALSRLKGAVGDAASVSAGNFDPTAFLSGVTPRLFGLVDLLELLGIDIQDLAEGPNVVSEALDRIESFVGDLERLLAMMDEAVADAQRLVDRAQRATNKADQVRQQAAQAQADIVALKTTVDTAVQAVLDQLELLGDADEAIIGAALTSPLTTLRNALSEIEQHAPKLPPLLRNQLEQLAKVLRTVLDAADLIEEITRFLNGLVSGEAEFAFRYEWAPSLERFWPSQSVAIIEFKRLSTDTTTPQNKVKGNFVLAVDGRANAKGKVAVDVLAELRDFVLHLLPGEPLVHIKFDHLSFRAGTSGKAEVDVVLEEIEFVGVLGFVETLRELIPFDGFADPPYLDVSPAGLSAGFDLDLPNVAIGVFALSNMSLGAELRVPFIGESVTVAFNFCSRERPFTLAVTFIGGGGWFLMQISPEGLDVLEVGLEAGATLSLDFGVASGSVSAMLGIYLRLEGDAGSLTGYFRLRGEVDVLGLISASIELYLSLEYDFPTGKMVGRARITVKVEVLFFSASVSIEAERRFAGANGDPSFREVMAVHANGTSTAWSNHCLAFAGA